MVLDEVVDDLLLEDADVGHIHLDALVDKALHGLAIVLQAADGVDAGLLGVFLGDSDQVSAEAISDAVQVLGDTAT